MSARIIQYFFIMNIISESVNFMLSAGGNLEDAGKVYFRPFLARSTREN